jgi:hypothetical protein
VLEEVDPSNVLSLAEIGQKFKEKEHEARNLGRALHAAYAHVYRSAKGGLLAVI